MSQEKSMYQTIETQVERYPAEHSLYYLGHFFSYRDLNNEIRRISAYLSIDLKIKKGDVVTICLPNIPATVIVFYALNRLGAIANMVHPLTPFLQVQQIITKTKSKHLFIFDSTLYKEEEKYRIMKEHITFCKASSYLSFFKRSLYDYHNRDMNRKLKGYIDYDHIRSYSPKEIPLTEYNECAAYLHSGGTTGLPKTIMLSNYGFNYLASQANTIFGSETVFRKNMLAVLPSFHGFGLCMCIHTPLANGMCSVLVPKFSSRAIVKIMKKIPLNCICGVPSLFDRLLSDQSFLRHKRLNALDVVFCGGDTMPLSLKSRFDALMEERGIKCRMMEGYGLTETVTVCCVNTMQENRQGSIGKMLKGMSCRILDEQNHEVPRCELGEICIQAPTIMMGYLDDEESTTSTIQGQYVHTGDIGYMDQDDFIYFKQRKKRIIKVSGVSVYPTEIEMVVMTLNNVANCAAIEGKDERGRSFVKLYVLLKEKNDLEQMRLEIIKTCQQNLFKWSIPKQIIFCDELPLTLVGKVDYKVLEKENAR